MHFQGTTKEASVRQNRALGGETDGERTRAGRACPEPLPPGPSAQEEAVLIAERLAALVESRAGAAAPRPPPPVARPVPSSAPGTRAACSATCS